jgi:hypothetical protein
MDEIWARVLHIPGVIAMTISYKHIISDIEWLWHNRIDKTTNDEHDFP